MLNAVEPGTVIPTHRHPIKDESFVILRGKVRVTTHNDEGPFSRLASSNERPEVERVPHEVDGILDIGRL